jgi:hypothetical protein
MTDLVNREARELTPGDWIRVRPRGRSALVMVVSVDTTEDGRVVVSHSGGVATYGRHTFVAVQENAECVF